MAEHERVCPQHPVGAALREAAAALEAVLAWHDAHSRCASFRQHVGALVDAAIAKAKGGAL